MKLGVMRDVAGLLRVKPDQHPLISNSSTSSRRHLDVGEDYILCCKNYRLQNVLYGHTI